MYMYTCTCTYVQYVHVYMYMYMHNMYCIHVPLHVLYIYRCAGLADAGRKILCQMQEGFRKRVQEVEVKHKFYNVCAFTLDTIVDCYM